jgi:hypothetical protein
MLLLLLLLLVLLAVVFWVLLLLLLVVVVWELPHLKQQCQRPLFSLGLSHVLCLSQ